MPFVLDSSVALAWFLPDEDAAAVDVLADRLEHDYAVVPAIRPLEIGNALLVAERRGRIKTDQLDRFVGALGALPIEVDPSPGATTLFAILELARKHGLTTYDAGYVELARRRALPLATLDTRVRKACAALNLGLLP
jgi:predicted nucleic acid-binding protein